MNRKDLKSGVRIGVAFCAGLILQLGLLWSSKDLYETYRDRQRSIEITGPVEVWEHYDLNLHNKARVLTILDKGSQVKVLRLQSGMDWASIKVRLSDGREGYIDLFAKQSYVLK